MTYTSIEQSKRLMELGLNPDSADLSYSNTSYRGLNYTEPFTVLLKPYKIHKRVLENVTDAQKNICMWEVLPCWSAECLLNLLPSIIKTGEEVRNWYWININKEPYQITYGSSLGSSGSWHDMISSTQSYNLVDVICSMMEWLLGEAKQLGIFPFDLNNELYGILGRTTEKEIV